jgi:hypothetical protein
MRNVLAHPSEATARGGEAMSTAKRREALLAHYRAMLAEHEVRARLARDTETRFAHRSEAARYSHLAITAAEETS